MTAYPSLPFASLLRPTREGAGRPYVLLRSRHRSAWLLPAGPAFGHTGLRAFGYTGVKALAARALISAKLIRGERVWLDVAALERALAAALGASEAHLAFSIGTSAASQKLTAQVTTRSGDVLAYAKLATDSVARGSLGREYGALMRLSKIDGLRHAVPGVLGWFPWGDAQVLLVTAGEGDVGSGRLTNQHAAFLRRLHEAFVHEAPFAASTMCTHMVTMVDRLTPRMPHAWALRWHRALALLNEGLGPVVLPLSLAHRDFAPWNTRIGPRGLFVFDWEMAADGVTPFYDVFHFHAVQAARTGSPFRPSRDSYQDILPAQRRTWQRHLPYLYLAYLLDMSLVSAEARLLAPHGEGPEWQWLGRRLDAWAEDHRAVA